jgi:2'-5' RNA ligase
MERYIIQFRFSGYAKEYLKRTIFEVARKFRVRVAAQKIIVPHITMFGPFTTNNESKVVFTLQAVSKKYHLIPFKLRGFGNFDKRVIFADIIPSEELKRFRNELSTRLTNLRDFFLIKTVKTEGISDHEEHYPFHATIAFKDIGNKFDGIMEYLNNKNTPHINQILLRVTLLNNDRILCEYDFLQKRLLTRRKALNKNIWRSTVRLLKHES